MKRKEGEKFEDYKKRRRNRNLLDKARRKGRLFWDSYATEKREVDGAVFYVNIGTLCKLPTEKSNQHEIDAYWRVVKAIQNQVVGENL